MDQWKPLWRTWISSTVDGVGFGQTERRREAGAGGEPCEHDPGVRRGVHCPGVTAEETVEAPHRGWEVRRLTS